MLISIYMKKKYLIHIILFMIINIISMSIIKILKINLFSRYFIYHICEICLVLLYIIDNYLSKNKNEEFNENNQKSIKIIFILIICYLIFNSIFIYLLQVNDNINDTEYYMRIIIFLILIERICLKNYFYSHQILSFTIIIILFFYFIINSIIQSSKLKIIYVLILIKFYSYSFRVHLLKYINMKYFINIYYLGSIKGIVGLIQILIQNKTNFPEFNLCTVCLIILLLIILMINVYLEYKIISELAPIHRYMTDFTSIYISEIIINKNFELILIGLLLIISCLIYLEIIQLNFCNLNKNTKINIEKRMNATINR